MKNKTFLSPGQLCTVLCAALLICGLALSTAGDDAKIVAEKTWRPQYTPGGELIRPTDFHTWVFVGSNLGLGYSSEAKAATPAEAARNLATETPDFHNVYLDPQAYRHFVEHGTFPDPTVLVMDKYVAQTKEPQGIVDRGSFNGAPDGFEVAVKNSRRPDGSKTIWAYYSFDLAGGRLPETAPAQADQNCYNCHKAHGDVDNVWVQFYPVIRASKAPGG